MKMTVKASGIDAIMKRLERNAAAAQKVLTATGNDLRSRVPGKVADDVRTMYNIKKNEITPTKGAKARKKAGYIRVEGSTVSEVEIVYRGRVLTPTHFGMTPKAPAKATPGRKARKRKITAQIKKGKRVVLDTRAFLAHTGAASADGVQYIPFRRTGKKRYPIEAIKTVSLPQMVSNQKVQAMIAEDINKMLAARLPHNIKRFMK